MNIFQRVTLKNLKENRTRTLVTIIGILLSAAMFTAVTVSISSLHQFLISHTVYTNGSWHDTVYDLTAKQTSEITNDERVSDSTLMNRLGFATLEDSQNPDKPYLCVYGVTDNFTELLPVHITSGRMPKNSNEILLPDHLQTNGSVFYSLNDTISLALGKRVDSTGYELDNHTPYLSSEEDDTSETAESIIDTTQHSYTVVGFYERPSFEDYSAPGYTALTLSDETTSGFYDIYFCTKDISTAASYLDNIITHFDSASGTANYSLLRLYGNSGESSYNAVLYNLAAILICIIAFGSISLIYNAFSISVSERTKQFGLLRSIGATKQQLTSSVLFEAFFLSMIGIPLGILCGIMGIGITFHFTGKIIAKYIYSDSGVVLSLHTSVPALLIAVLISLVTILISAWLPARRSMKTSAIDAIRQTKDISIRSGKIKTSRLTKKLFGFEGMIATKNYKRNRKKYRATVISLFLSIVLFISASSFCAYLTASTSSVINDSGCDISYSYSEEDGYSLVALMTELSEIPSITSSSFDCTIYSDGTINADALSTNYKDFQAEISGQSKLPTDANNLSLQGFYLRFIQDDVFRDYLNTHNLSEKDYFNAQQPTAIVLNTTTVYMDSKYHTFSIFSDTDNADINLYFQKNKEDYSAYGHIQNETGAIVGLYSMDASDTDTLELPLTESSEELPLHIGAALTDAPNMTYTDNGYINLFFPYSMIDHVFSFLESDVSYANFPCDYPVSKHLGLTLSFQCKDHAQAMTEIQKVLSSHNLSTGSLYDHAASQEQERALITVINVFSYGFIILISLIAAANVFNTISTNISLRKREFAMLKSIGLTPGGFQKMMNFECLLYGFKGLLYGLPVSILVTWWIYRSICDGLEMNFFIPWYSIVIAIGSVFLVVFATMLYSMKKIKKENIMETLKDENI